MAGWEAALPKPRYFDEDLWGADTWPLLSAAYTGDIETVAAMLDESPGLIRAMFADHEALHYAVRGGSAAMVGLLLRRGGNPLAGGWGNRQDEDTPLARAVDREREDMAGLLKRAAETFVAPEEPGEKPRSARRQREFAFLVACGQDNRAEVERMLQENPELATVGLYEAVHHARREMVKRLLEAGADVKGHMAWACWYTPLMHSLRYPEPRWDLAELLVERGTPVDSTNGMGMTALHIVAREGTVEAARWLLERGANVNAVEPEHYSTPLGWAARRGRREMARLLLDHGADASLPVEHFWARPRRWAERKGHAGVAEMLR